MSTGRSDRHSDRIRDFAERLRRELRADEAPAAAVPDARRGYREAACLLTRFDPMLLTREGEERPGGGAVLELLDDCTTVGMEDRAVWTLKAEVRETTLRNLAGPGAARRSLERNLGAVRDGPGPERICLSLLDGERPPATGLSPRELTDTLTAVLWLSRVPGVGGLPDPAALQHALERARLLQPLERLVRRPFQGRARELAEVRRHVHGEDGPGSPGGASGPAPPLVIHGPGGMGKSTLVAKFLLDSIGDRDPGFPFAYIDFERPTLSIREPVTLVAEMARQLGIQYPAHQEELTALVDECRRTARSQREGEERVTQLHRLATTRSLLGRGSSQEFQLLATERETGLIRRTAEVLLRATGEAGQADAPFLVVVDSFEEIQYRGSPVLGRLWAMFLSLQTVCPRLRVVVSGRARVEHPMRVRTSREIELTELDQPAAVALLTSSGVRDPEVARVLADRVGGHPLSLRLAARAAVLAGGEADGAAELIRSLPARRDAFFREVDRMLVQGILYDRVLHHIADRDVRRLARPGLVLRIITPEIIKEVLAEPCGLRVESTARARRLFDELSRLDLMEPAGPGAVRHRGDIRAIMLRLPGGDRTEAMRAVERRAVAYYAAREGLDARAEEIYHRLRLDQNPRDVEKRWLPGVDRLLSGAERDLPHRAAGLLTARLGGDAPRQVMTGADQEDWERIAAREIEDLLAQGFAEAALVRLGERRPWQPCGPLHALLAETLNRLGRSGEARRTVSDAVVAAESAGCAGRRLELLLLSARLAEDAGDLAGADGDLRRAEDIAVGLGQDLEAMGALLARARLAARSGPPGSTESTESTANAGTAGTTHGAETPEGSGTDAAGRLADKLRLVPDAVLADQPALVRAVASQVYARDPDALEHAVEVVGLPSDDEALETLGAAIQGAASRQPTLLGPLMGILRDAAGPARPQHGTGPSSTTGILRLARDRGALDTVARRLLAVPDRSGEITSAVAAAMGAGTDGRLRPAAPPPERAPGAAPRPPGPRVARPDRGKDGTGLVRPGPAGP
ncbi:AAA family ATPase [Streptomyces sp. NPDC014894]|uniref:AAA family ATPase n=1 Tax=Streptomyces sp. NPDC014894 TaxID=3364931 RepID=UPI0037000D71